MSAPVPVRMSVEMARAYRHCEQLAWTHYENFGIGAWLVPRRLRPHVATLYAFVRIADDFADEGAVPVATRLARLDGWQAALEQAYAGRASDPIFIALAHTISTFAIPIEPFRQLLDAFRADADWRPFTTDDDLLAYCRMTADPVGHLVLYLCGYRDAERRHLSNKVCTGLQLSNFWQDLGADVARGRLYLPTETLRRYGCKPAEVAGGEDSAALRRCVHAEVERASRLLREGEALADVVERPFAREVRLFVAAGLAILAKIAAAGCSVMTRRPVLSRGEQTKLLFGLALPRGLWRRRRRERYASPRIARAGCQGDRESRTACAAPGAGPSQEPTWLAFVADLRRAGVPVKEDRVSRSLFVSDAGGLAFGMPKGVVTTRSAEHVGAVLRAAQRHRVPVTTRGGGLTTDGESVANEGCLLDMSAMNRVLEVDADALTARVEAGIHWHTLAEHLRRKELDYISAPLNFTSSVGGTLAVGGIDVNSFRHGCSADQAVALRVVTPTGCVVDCSERDHAALFEQVLFGYGQFGVIVEATLRIRPYTPIALTHWMYSSLRQALEDYIAIVEAGASDYAGVITLNDTANTLFVGFDSDDRERMFASTWIPRLRGMTLGRFVPTMLLQCGMRPWRWREALWMARRACHILRGLHRAEHQEHGKLLDRAALLSRLVWTEWGGRQVINPNLCTTAAKLIPAVEHGAAVCRRWFRFYTLYIVSACRRPDRTRYELSAVPPDAGELAFGCSFEPTIRPDEYSPEQLQRFKNEIFSVGLAYQTSYYRFGGGMKPYIRRALGDVVVDRHLAVKRDMDPGMILNPHVIF